MDRTHAFLRGPSGNQPDPDTSGKLRRYHSQLESMRDMVLYQLDHIKITQTNIDMLTKDLNEIIGSIDKMLRTPDVDIFFPSLDEIQSSIRQARKCLHIASGLLTQTPTPRNLNARYEKFEEFCDILHDAIHLFPL